MRFNTVDVPVSGFIPSGLWLRPPTASLPTISMIVYVYAPNVTTQTLFRGIFIRRESPKFSFLVSTYMEIIFSFSVNNENVIMVYTKESLNKITNKYF